ncbi:telomere repeat-binding factor 4-like [Lycium ferocissimum]|uniref:telomere repeat-binding factor 4-like n=1 Tax=Lycium ferocissimum TaxID=112874 RepID=UPI002815462E|nr:telomere repeat-binding factor 4-like [Lycium ferocissimum]
MGNRKVKWTSEEEEALKAGVAKHGTGRWKNILRDPQFAPLLTNRSNIDLKDKWRNMCIYTAAQGQGSKDKSRSARARPVAIDARVPSTAQSFQAITSALENEAIDDSPRSPQEGSNAPKYKDMIFEALSSMKGSYGSDLGAIVGFIEQRHEVPQNFRKLLSSKLRRLVLQGKLEKVQNCYKIKDATLETKTPTPIQRDVRSLPAPNSAVKVSCETAEEAARIAADKIVDAENKSYLEAEAVKDAEMKSKMADDAETMLQLVKEIYEQCSRGEIVFLA